MSDRTRWITGATRTGKTTCLVEQFAAWVNAGFEAEGGSRGAARLPMPMLSQRARLQYNASHILVVADNGDNRLDLTDRLTVATQGQCPIQSVTPLGFFEDQVVLFWSLLIQRLNLKAQFPIRLRPETEQELATRLWRAQLDDGVLQQPGVTEPRLVRRMLDWLQLAALAGIPAEDITVLLEQGLPGTDMDTVPPPWTAVGNAILTWRDWCLEQGFLTYGIIAELYWRHLLPDATYRHHLHQTYWAVLADDVDNYPAIAHSLFTTLLDQGAAGLFTYNPDGAVRLGLGADPKALEQLATRCQVTSLDLPPVPTLADSLAADVLELVDNPISLVQLPEPTVQSIQTVARAQLLRQVSEAIAQAIQTGQAQPQDIAIIAPGLDAIARYTLSDLLASQGIPARVLNEQRPLINSAIVRALLTLLTLIYPGMGRLINREAVAEMLVILSQTPTATPALRTPNSALQTPHSKLRTPNSALQTPNSALQTPNSALQTPHFPIDPVRAGLIVDHCFEPHPDLPQLLPVNAFPRWDRLGYQVTDAYEGILQWLESQKQQQAQRLIPSGIVLLDRAIQQFLWGGSHLPYEQVAALRELMETAQHYWDVENRLRQSQPDSGTQDSTVAQFIQLLRSGAITANPFPVRSLGNDEAAVTLANVFQYRALRCHHRWHCWLDMGANSWLSGTDSLYGYALFLREWSGRPWTEEENQTAHEQRLHRILLDLLGRASDRLLFCHSELATNGQEQVGPLLALVSAATNDIAIDAVGINSGGH